MDRHRTCKDCREKFTFDEVGGAQFADGVGIARFKHKNQDVGIMFEGRIICNKCITKRVEASGLKPVDVSALSISRWLTDDNKLVALTWNQETGDGIHFKIVRAFSLLTIDTEVIEKVEKQPGKDKLMASEQEARDAGLREVDPDSFSDALSRKK